MTLGRAGLALLLLSMAAGDLRAQGAPGPDGLSDLLHRLEQVTQAGDADAYFALLASSANQRRATDFARGEIVPGATRAVIQERDRTPLDQTTPPTRFRVYVDVFVEFGARGRVASWQIDAQRGGETWRITDQERLSAVENLYRLSLDRTRAYDAHALTISVEDLDLSLENGTVHVAATDSGVTGLVLVGRGEMRFHPRPDSEKGQVKIFCGRETLDTRFEAAFVRINPADFARLVATDALTPRSVDPREFRRADEVFQEEAGKSYQLALGDLSADPWWLLPTIDDFVAEVRTRRFGTLTYARANAEPEDITLFDRKKHKNIAAYASMEKEASRGRFYREDDHADYDVLDYNIDVAVSPDRQWIDGVVRVLMEVKAPALTSLAIRLADPLVVRSIVSDRFGRLFGFRVRNTGLIVISLPAAVPRETLMTLTFVYAGRLEPQAPDRENAAVGEQDAPDPTLIPEPSFLYSNRSYWYPQANVTDYATATIKISVPAEYDCVASGDLAPGWPQLVGNDAASERKVYWFSAGQPLRYLAFIISRFARTDTLTVVWPDTIAASRAPDTDPRGVHQDSLALAVEANPRQTKRGRGLIERAADIAQFYASLVGDCPFPSFTIALIDSELPGGHSPGYFAALNQPLPNTTLVWRNDPTAFEKYPEFFLAHELAHQWWGQTVGWANYHEQWLSEGFAQYFATLYAEHARGADVFAGILRRMRRSALDDSDQGAIYLGYRLGHIQGDSRIFRALVYNKGAAVLHMLRRLVGDDAFFRGLRRFYATARFRKASTDDFRKAMEAETDRPLDRFFERWVYGSTLPSIKLSYTVDSGDVAIRLEQMGDVFELPVTVHVEFAGAKDSALLVRLTERSTTVRVPLAAPVRGVELSTDDGALFTPFPK